MLETIIERTSQYINLMPKKERKKYGQFFTSIETARFMASLYDMPKEKLLIKILDAGAGTGILACALVERLIEENTLADIELVCYETDSHVLEILEDNLTYISNCCKQVRFTINTENYITSQYLEFNNLIGGEEKPKKYDLIIGNPPYMKIPKDAPEAKAMSDICYGAPNLYFLFASMGAFNLTSNGQMVYIIPRSWTSGAYFNRFREFFLQEVKLNHIHLFVSRNKVFDNEKVLQETIIVKVVKMKKTPPTINMTTSVSNKDFESLTSLIVSYDLIVNRESNYVFLVTNTKEVETLNRINIFTNTLPDIGLKMKTGLTVDFRNRDLLRNEEEEGTVPLFYSQHITNGEVRFPIQKEYEYILSQNRGLIQTNKNYLFVKRFTAKEETRRLQCGVYLSKNYESYKKISTQNKINFIEGLASDLSECVVYGLYVLFNSTIYDEYYRILNGSTQVNSTEINSMPIPKLEIIQEIGQRLMQNKDLSVENCNTILEGHCG